LIKTSTVSKRDTAVFRAAFASVCRVTSSEGASLGRAPALMRQGPDRDDITRLCRDLMALVHSMLWKSTAQA
jgi:hypothetical protein